MSDTTGRFEPAIGMLEFDSIVAGIVAADAMAKASPVTSLFAGTVQPGRYLVLVGGTTAAVEIALEAGGTDTLVDSLFLADVHPAVIAALTTTDPGVTVDGDALGVVETAASASSIAAADAGVKAADVSLLALRLADGLGGKAYSLFTGIVADVEAAVDAAVAGIDHRHTLVMATVIPRLHGDMADKLAVELRFNRQLEGLDGSS